MKGQAKKRKPQTFTHSKKPPEEIASKNPQKEQNPHDRLLKRFGSLFHRRAQQSVLITETKEKINPSASEQKQVQKTEGSQIYPLVAGILIMLNFLALGAILYFQQELSHTTILTQYHADSALETVPQLTNANLNITAKSAIIFDTASRTAIYQKQANFRFAPASTTKIMTAVIALEHYNLDDVVTVPYSVSTIVGSKMNLVGGERITVRNLLYGMLLPSGNDAAYTLATLDPQGVKGFVAKMNQKVHDLKMDNTHFVDSNGYDDANYTSAFDLARLAAYALRNPMFRQVVQTRSITVTDVTGSIVYHLENLNKLLSNSDVFGIKTGFTNEAGEVLVTSYEWQGRTYIIVVMKSLDRFADTQKLMNAIQTSVHLEQY